MGQVSWRDYFYGRVLWCNAIGDLVG
jgi:hypothetical protein